MKGRLLFLQSPSPTHKATSFFSSSPSRHRSCLLVNLASFFTVAALLFLLLSSYQPNPTPPLQPPSTTSSSSSSPPPPILPAASPFFDALLHYAALSSSGLPGAMPEPDLRAAAAVLLRRRPCNLLVFGLGHESPLWLALNHGGRSVFLEPNEPRAARFEEQHRPAHPGVEAYSPVFPTRVADLRPVLAAARAESSGACRPVQDLLFSDCPLALTDLPNHLYRVEWDVVLIDGPPGYHPEAPGRAAAIFTAAVLARSVGREGGATDVLVHDYDREAEQAAGEEFLCLENLVGSTGKLAHFVIRRGGPQSGGGGFCRNRTAAAAAAAAVAVAL